MKDFEIKMALKNMRRNKNISSETELYMEKDMELVLKYFNKMKEENPKIIIEEMQKKFVDEQYGTLVKFSKSANIRGLFFQYEAAEFLLKNKNKISDIYNEVKDNYQDNGNDIYNANKENCIKILVKEMIYALKNRNIDKETLNFGEQYKKADAKKKKGMEAQLTKEEKKVLEELVTTTTDNEKENVYNLIKFIIPDFESELKQNLIKSMEAMGEFFERFNLIDIYKALNSSMTKNLGLSKMEQPLYLDKFGKNEVELKKLFSEEVLNEYSVEDLLMLNAFWQNRFAKESESVNNGAFSIKELQILENGGKTYKFIKEDVKLIDMKIRFLDNISDILSVKIKQMEEKKNGDKAYDKGWSAVDSSQLVKNILTPFQKEYDEIIQEETGNKDNDIISDYYDYSILHNQLQNSYICKNSMIVNILNMLSNSKKVSNWGYIPNELYKGKVHNTFEENSKFMLLGIDYEGMNMPIRLHIKKDLIQEFLKENKSSNLIPIYQGDDDFVRLGKVLPTHILMPVSNKYKRVVNEYLEKSGYSEEVKNLLEHLRYIKDNKKYPEHWKEIKVINGKITKAIPERKYINIDTGEIFIKDKKEFKEYDGGKEKNDAR